jgi:hypothetical protein
MIPSGILILFNISRQEKVKNQPYAGWMGGLVIITTVAIRHPHPKTLSSNNNGSNPTYNKICIVVARRIVA